MAATEERSKYRPAHCRQVQQVGGEVGPTYEVIILRTQYVSAQTEVKTWIIACGVSLANVRDLGEWIGAFNLQLPAKVSFLSHDFCLLFLTLAYSSTRPLDMDVHIQSFSIPHFPSLIIAMSKPAYLAIAEYSQAKMVIIPSLGTSNAA